MAVGTRLVVVDDHPGFMEALALYLNESDDLTLIGSASTFDSALDLLQRVTCDVVVLAHPLGGERGFGVASGWQAQLRQCERPVPILVVSDGTEDAGILEAVGLGVCGWVWRQDGLAELATAVQAVARGEGRLPVEPLRSLLVDRIEQVSDGCHLAPHRHALTQRESAVLEGLAAGLTRKELGQTLQLTPNTVRTHVRSILRKLHVHSAPAAVELLVEEDRRHG